jgi:ADP-heptose:LPS heptosyltransferase
MGDVAMTVPVIRGLINQNFNYKISILTNQNLFTLFREFDNINLIKFDKKNRHKGIRGLFKLYFDIKSLKVDHVIDLHNVIRTKFLKVLLQVPFYQINKGRLEKKKLINGQHFKQLKSTHQRYVDVFLNLGISFQPLIKENTPKDISNLNIVDKNSNRKLIGVAPFAAHKSKVYPIDLMKKVIIELSKKHTIILFGGGVVEKVKLDEIARISKDIINIANLYSMDKELDIISNLNIMVSMDSANGHLAAMLGVQVVTLWGLTHPYGGFKPFGQELSNSLYLDKQNFPKVPTSIYGNKIPNGYESAFRSIQPQQVINKVNELI